MDSCCIKPTNNMKKIIQHIVLVFLFFQACAQPVENTVSYELKTYNFVNLPEGISNLQYKVYPENTIIASGLYQDISEVGNQTVEDLLRSRLSENTLQWVSYNRDFDEKGDEEYILKMYKERVKIQFKFSLHSLITYEYKDTLFARVIFNMSSDSYDNLINSKACVRKNQKWLLTKQFTPNMGGFIIGNKNIHPHSAYNIYNKNPQNEGERLLLAQSLNEKGELDFEKLSAALYTIQEQAAENEDIRKILLIEDFE